MLTIFLAQGLNQTANIIKGFAIAIGIAIAVGFVCLWWAHRQKERRQELASRARGVWRDWLRLAVAHPELADPTVGMLSQPADLVRYRAFVASLITAADEVLLLDSTPHWIDAIGQQLLPHRALLASQEFQERELVSSTPAVRAVVASVIARPGSRAQAARPGLVPTGTRPAEAA